MIFRLEFVLPTRQESDLGTQNRRTMWHWALIAASLQTQTIPMEELDLRGMVQEWGQPQKARSVDRNPLSIGGVRFATGVGTHANSSLTVLCGGKAIAFRAKVGVDDEVGTRGSVEFLVLKDGKTAWRSGVLRGGQPAKECDVPLRGAKTVEFRVTDAGDGIDYDHANWAEARLELLAGAGLKVVSQPEEPPMKIASHRRDRTELHGPRIVGTTPGRPFLFRIPATGKAPLRFAARNLPEGLSLDPATGIVRGRVAKPGTFDVKVEVSGPAGRDSRTIRIVAGKGKLALTPPLGWNSWNVWGLSVSADKVRDAARAFVETGLAGYGYQYVNIDDGWEAGRAPDGEILCNEKFPDMKALADEVHALGLKLGIYSSPGPKTCGGYEGSYRHELQDARTYAKWGIDYLKYDWCSYGQIAKDNSLVELQKPYKVMREALDSVDRDIVYSLCQYGMGEVWKWGNFVGGDLWRTTGDITDTWGSMSSIGFAQGKIVRFSGPSGWNDPDMLVVGMVGWGPSVRPNRLTKNEQITHISLWAMLAAPFLIGCDLTKLDEFTKDLLMNHEILEIQQDPLGKPPVQRALGDGTEVWTRRLWDGTTAVALFNRNLTAKEMVVAWSSIGIQGTPRVVDCWLRKDLGRVPGGLRRRVPGHGAMVFKFGTPKPAW